MPIEIPKFLVESVRSNDAIAFVGSGLSYHARGPSWNELLAAVIRAIRPHIDPVDVPRLTAAQKALSEGRPINAATILDEIRDIDIRMAIADAIRDWKWDLQASDAYQNLLRLNLQAIVTTNYDRVLEETQIQRGVASELASYSHGRFLDAIQPKRRFILHLHGDIDNPQDIVATWPAYDALASAEVMQYLASLILNYTTLWIGYGHNDPHVVFTLARLARSRKAFQVIPAKDYELAALCRARNVTPLYADSYDDLPVFLRTLATDTGSTSDIAFLSDSANKRVDVDQSNVTGCNITYFFLRPPLTALERLHHDLVPPKIVHAGAATTADALFAKCEKRDGKRIAIVAPPGVGKTVLLSRFAQSVFKRLTDLRVDGLWPIVVYLSPDSLAGPATLTAQNGVWEHIEKTAADLTAPYVTRTGPDVLARWSGARALYVLFDGIDEFGARRKGELEILLQGLCSLATDRGLNVVITCRAVFWMQQLNQAQRSQWEQYDLRPFTAEEITKALAPDGLGPFAYDGHGRLKPGISNSLIVSLVLEVRATRSVGSLATRSDLFDTWLQVRVARTTADHVYDLWIGLFRDTALALLESKTAAVPLPDFKTGQPAPLDDCLATGVLTPSNNRDGVKIFHESLNDYLVAAALVDSFQQIVSHPEATDELNALPLARVDLDFLQPSVYGFLYEQLPDAYDVALLEALNGRDLSLWKPELVRNLVEYIGMTHRGGTDTAIVEWLLDLLKSGLAPLVRYNAARALERIHPWAPRPYGDYMSDWGDRGWTEVRRQAATDQLAPWAIRGSRMRGEVLVQRKPGKLPYLAIWKGSPRDTALEARVSDALARLIRGLLERLDDERLGHLRSAEQLDWLLINYSHAWVRWFHPEHCSVLEELRTTARRILFKTKPLDENQKLASAASAENLIYWVGRDQSVPGLQWRCDCVPAEDWRRHAAQVTVLEMNPDVVQPALSVQSEWNGSQGIIRGLRDGDVLVEDHIRELLDEDGQVVDVGATGRKMFGPADMRAQVWTAEEHLRAYMNDHPESRVLGWVGNGNLLSNPHFVAFDGSREPGTLFHLGSETPHLVHGGRTYSCLVVRRPDGTPRVSIERLRFAYLGRFPQVYTLDGRSITSEVEYATYGQLLVSKGQVVDTDSLVQMARNGEFYDLRHVFLMGRIGTGRDRWIDAGLATFWLTHGGMDADAVAKAIKGEPTSVNVRQFGPETVRRALKAKGYNEVRQPVAPGDYSIDDTTLTIVFRPGIYPHNLIGIRPDGRLIAVAIEGTGNRIGVTIQGAAEVMRSLGAEHAVMLDNGRDVMMALNGTMVTASSEGARARLRSMLLFRTARTNPIGPTDLRLVRYPAEAAISQ